MWDVIVVGGGLGGLLVAVESKRRGGSPLVLEASGRPGGVAQTVLDRGYLLEPAAGSVLLPNPDLDPILAAAGTGFVPAKWEAKMRFVYDRGTLFGIPESPAFLFTRLVSWSAKLRAAREPWIQAPPPEGEESLLDFFTRRFGPQVGRLGADLMAHGVFAGDPASLSIAAAFPKLVALEAEAGSVVRGGIRRRKLRSKGAPRGSVHVPIRGMTGFAEGLASYLGEGFVAGRRVLAVEPEDGHWKVEWEGGAGSSRSVVVALAPEQAGALLPEPLRSQLTGRPSAPVAVVGLGGPSGSLRLPGGFGALAGPASGIRALGILFESEYAPDRAPSGHQLAKGIYGGAADPGIMDAGDEELVGIMRGELGRLVGHTADPEWTRVVRSSIPQYPIGHAGWLEDVDRTLGELPGLHLAGWGYRGIGISSLAADAVRIGSILEGDAR